MDMLTHLLPLCIPKTTTTILPIYTLSYLMSHLEMQLPLVLMSPSCHLLCLKMMLLYSLLLLNISVHLLELCIPSTLRFLRWVPIALLVTVNFVNSMKLLVQKVGTNCSTCYRELRQLGETIGSKSAVCAHLDGGAMTLTTDLLNTLWYTRAIPHGSIVLAVADNRKHYPTKQGYLCVPTLGSTGGHVLILCYYTPTLPATIISPDAAGRALHCSSFEQSFTKPP